MASCQPMESGPMDEDNIKRTFEDGSSALWEKPLSMASDVSMQEPLAFEDDDPHHQKGSLNLQQSVLLNAPEQPTATDIKTEDDFQLYQQRDDANTILQTHQSNLNEKFQCLFEGSTLQGTTNPLKKIFVDLFITEGGSGETDREHEMRQIETTSRRLPSLEMQIKCNDIFKSSPGQSKPIRTVLTKGVAGVGKTVSVQKFILDWTKREANTDVHLIFPLPFRELNLIKSQNLSLKDLLGRFFPVTKEGDIFSKNYKILFIFDGLDECRLPLDFQKNVRLSDVTESASLDVLMTNLFMGNLLPSALIWITSRPGAANQVPIKYFDRETEVLGFNDSQKEEYFMKRISNQIVANKVITHMKSSRTLFAMCQIPVFCWIAVTVLERTLNEKEIPKTLTSMYTQFLTNQTKKRNVKAEMLLKLGQLAFHQLMKGNLIFYEDDLKDCGIEVSEASDLSMVCNEVFKEESGLGCKKVYTFIHLSIQEHLAATYVHLSFVMHNKIVLEPSVSSRFQLKLQLFIGKDFTIFDLHKLAVNEALSNKNGHLDPFLRFLLGLSLQSNQALLCDMMALTRSSFHDNEKTIEYIKRKISENPPGERYINLFHCLNELDSPSLVEDVQNCLKDGKLKQRRLSSSDWSALVFLLTSVDMDELVLRDYCTADKTPEEVLLKLLPVVKACKAADLKFCDLTSRSCTALVTVLRSRTSNLRELNLSQNFLEDSGVKLLCAGLGHTDCKLTKLKVVKCEVEAEGCSALASALIYNPSHLKSLDLSENKLEDAGVKQLSLFLKNPHCKLEELSLWGCSITEEGCAALVSMLRSNPSHLRLLDLATNTIHDAGVKLLCGLLEMPICQLQILRLRYCGLTDESCSALVSALNSNPSHLKVLNLSGNDLDEGIKHIFALRDDSHYGLQKVTYYTE